MGANQQLMMGEGAITALTGYYSATRYTGNGSNGRAIAGVDMTAGGMALFIYETGGVNPTYVVSPDGVTLTGSLSTGTSQSTTGVTFTSTGMTVSSNLQWNQNAAAYTVWMFRKVPKFLDVVFYTGNGSSQNIAHSLKCAVGLLMVRNVTTPSQYRDWSVVTANNIFLDTSSGGTAAQTSATIWNNTAPTTSVFSVGNNSSTNKNAASYIAVLFAHDTSPTGVIQMLSHTGNGSASGPSVLPGYQPRFVYCHSTSSTTAGAWCILDQVYAPGFTGTETLVRTEGSVANTTGTFIGLVTNGVQWLTTNANLNTNAVPYFDLLIK